MINNIAGVTPTPSLSSFSKCVNNKIDLVANTPIAVLGNNSKRMYAAFINNSSTDITLVLGDKLKAVVGEGIIIKGYGGSYEITLINLYTGKISAISASATQLSFTEGFE